jgi:transposase
MITTINLSGEAGQAPIVFTRMVNDPRTKHYIERRMKEGRTKKEAIRCLKRYVAREVFAALPRSQFTLESP